MNKGDFGNYHDFYSRTYPKYQGYSSKEQQKDLMDLVNAVYTNNNIEFRDSLYFKKDGSLDPTFKAGVLSAVAESMSGETSVILVDIVNQALCASVFE